MYQWVTVVYDILEATVSSDLWFAMARDTMMAFLDQPPVECFDDELLLGALGIFCEDKSLFSFDDARPGTVDLLIATKSKSHARRSRGKKWRKKP